MNDGAIGVFDSGLGGLSIWRELRKSLPGESLYYFGDGKNCPYGNKSREEVIGFVDRGVAALVERGIKLLVVACNAATASAVEFLRAKYDFPIIGMEPAVKPAAESTVTGVVGVLATRRTLEGELFARTALRYSDRVRIVTAVGEGFVELVEQGMEDTAAALEQVRSVLAPMLEADADRIVLGCTHYPFLKAAMRSVIGVRDVEIIDPAAAIERRVEQLLDQHHLRASADHRAEYCFFSAAGDSYSERIRLKSESLLGIVTAVIL